MRELGSLVRIELVGPLWHGGGAEHRMTPGAPDKALAVCICCAGRLDITTPSGCLSLSDGAACVISPSEPHTVLAGAGTSYAHLELAPGIFEECLPDHPACSLALRRYALSDGSRSTVLPDFYCEDVRVLLKRIEHRLAEEAGRWHLSLRGMVGDLLLALEEGLATHTAGTVDVTAVIDYLQENLGSTSLRSTAEHFYCHPNSIANTIKRAYGATFSEVVTEMRMQRADALLRASELSVQDIAAACGYHNMTHFYAVFREHFAMSPGEFRAIVRA